MPYLSQNGWPASEHLPLRPLVVAGESFSPGVLDNDEVFTVLQYVAVQLNARVERIWAPGWHAADDWGFYFRPNVNDPDSLSNHSSGTAFDYNATRHPNGVPTRSTFTAAQIAEVHQILAEVDHVVRWGGDYTGTPDAMHFEINANAAAVRAVAIRLSQEDDMPYTPAELKTIVSEAVREEVADIKATVVAQGEKTRARSITAAQRLARKGRRDGALTRDDLAELAEALGVDEADE